MSYQSGERLCQWDGCTNAAAKHLTFSRHLEVLGVNDGGMSFSTPAHHADLCARHLTEAQTYVGGHARELSDVCSPECSQYGWEGDEQARAKGVMR